MNGGAQAVRARHIVITGASGDIGGYIAQFWLARDSDVTCLTRSEAPPGTERVGWALGRAVPDGVFQRNTVVVHCAFNVEESRDRGAAFDEDVMGSLLLYEDALRRNVDTFVFVSSANALGLADRGTKPRYRVESEVSKSFGRHTYSQHKRDVEAQLIARNGSHGTRLIVLRPSMVVGPNFRNSALQAFQSRVGIYPSPTRSWYQFLDVEDFAHAMVSVVESGVDGVFQVAPDDAINVRQIYDISGGTVLDVPLRCASFAADVAFRLRASPFSGHWVSYGDPILSSAKLQETTGWRPHRGSAEVWRKFCTGII
ncbi:NAD-dependent epimerase/dehydratase family protein [Rhodococcus sp. IEGM1428]|uniref:NAD-dependent epimerase/dehydratase family protein n=1 Tax=Rhodococcus sp. IEGM1428 TaxID=3392191 RepID=UPI003D0AAA03